MPDVADLRARLTANVADLKKGFNEATAASDDLGSSFQRLKNDVAPINQAVASVGEASGALSAAANDVGRDLALVAAGGQLTSEGMARLAVHLTEAAHAEALFAAANPVENATRLAAAFTDVAAANPSRTIAEVANVSAFLAATNPAAPMAALAEASARLAAVNPAATIGAIAAQATELATAATIAPTAIEAIVAALVTVAPAVAAAVVAFVLFEKILGSANESLKLNKKTIDDWEKDLTAGINKARDSLLKLEFKANIAGLGPINTAIREATENAQLEGRALGLTAGEFDNYVEKATRAATITAGFGAAAKESQAAAEKLGSAASAIADGFSKLEIGLQFKSAEESFSRLQNLAAELNFKGPIADLQKLATALDQNEAKVRAIAIANKNYQASEAEIRAEVEKTNALIKQRFTADQTLKFKLDQVSLASELAKVPDTKTILLKFAIEGGIGGPSQKSIEDFIQTNPAEARAKAQILADVARMRQEGQDIFTTGSAPTVTPQLDTAPATQQFQDLLDQFSAANPTIDITPQIVMSPAVPFAVGVANMRAMVNSFARNVPRINFRTNLSDVIDESAAWSKRLGDFLKPTGAFDILAQGISADTAQLVRAISEAREEARFFTSRADISGGVHLAQVLTPSGFLPGDAERAQAFNNLAAKLERLLATIEAGSHESNDIARANLDATKGIARGLASSFFATDILKQQQQAQRVVGGRFL